MEHNRLLVGTALILVVLVLVLYFPWGAPQRGAPKVPVTGTVTVNDEPAAGIQVRFFAKNGHGLMMQDQLPVAVADKEGRFSLSSFDNNDGAVPGDYIVVFFWPVNLLEPQADRLKGRLSDPAKSKFHITIPNRATQLDTLQIEMNPKDILPREVGFEQLELMTRSPRESKR